MSIGHARHYLRQTPPPPLPVSRRGLLSSCPGDSLKDSDITGTVLVDNGEQLCSATLLQPGVDLGNGSTTQYWHLLGSGHCKPDSGNRFDVYQDYGLSSQQDSQSLEAFFTAFDEGQFDYDLSDIQYDFGIAPMSCDFDASPNLFRFPTTATVKPAPYSLVTSFGHGHHGENGQCSAFDGHLRVGESVVIEAGIPGVLSLFFNGTVLCEESASASNIASICPGDSGGPKVTDNWDIVSLTTSSINISLANISEFPLNQSLKPSQLQDFHTEMGPDFTDPDILASLYDQLRDSEAFAKESCQVTVDPISAIFFAIAGLVLIVITVSCIAYNKRQPRQSARVAPETVLPTEEKTNQDAQQPSNKEEKTKPARRPHRRPKRRKKKPVNTSGSTMQQRRLRGSTIKACPKNPAKRPIRPNRRPKRRQKKGATPHSPAGNTQTDNAISS